MGLLDDLKPEPRSYPCKVRTICETLDMDDAVILNSAVMDTKWSILGLTTALGQKGILLAPSVVKKHRDKACSCWKI
jgi:hypothetical protein